MSQVAIDVGGTFTDAVLTDGERIYTIKTPTSNDIITGCLNGFTGVCEASDGTVGARDVESFSHGSTVAVNTLIEEEGAETAFITTAGFRDVLEIGPTTRSRELLYNLCGSYESPLVPRKHRYEISERVDADGNVVDPISMDEVDQMIEDLDENDIESVAIVFIHAYKNESHEREVATRIRQRLPDISISVSSEVSPKIREYPRACTTTVDAYVKPNVSSYVNELESRLQNAGFTGVIGCMKSDGGAARPQIVARRPITQLIAGPIAGVRAANFIGGITGHGNLITFDMGGTSVDTALIQDSSPVEEQVRDIKGMKINGPFTRIHTAGAGGGSIARVTDVNMLQVGPDSAGANPGPVCYDRGGTSPAVTDADLFLGLLNPENFAGGRMTLNADLAEKSIETRIAEPLGIDTRDAALGIKAVIDNKLADTIRTVSVQEGYDPREFALMGYGGGGPLHACDVARELGIKTIIFPNNPGLFSAFGLLVSDIKHEYVRSIAETLDEAAVGEINGVISTLVEEGTKDLHTEGVAKEDRTFTVSFDMMYSGQAFPLNVPYDASGVTQEDIATLAERFTEKHRAKYGFINEQSRVELVNVRIMAEGITDDPSLPAYNEASGTADAAIDGTRTVIVASDRTIEIPYYDRERLATGHSIEGPGIVELDNSTIWIPPEFDASVDRYSNIIAERE